MPDEGTYWIVPRDIAVMWVPSDGGPPTKGRCPFFVYKEDGDLVMFVAEGEFHHRPNRFEKALADRGYYGLWIEPSPGFPGMRSVWFHPRHLSRL